MKKLKRIVSAETKEFRGGEEYKSLSLFIVGVVGFLLLIYVGFGLITVAIKADRMVKGGNVGQKVPSDVGMVKRAVENDAQLSVDTNYEKVDVIVKEVFGQIVNVNNGILTIKTKVYGDEEKNIRLKLENETGESVFKYETNDNGVDVEIAMKMDELKEGMYLVVKLPVEILLSEIERDIIYVNSIIVDTEYKGGEQE